MAIQVVEIHHAAIRIDGNEPDLKANLDFYGGLPVRVAAVGWTARSGAQEEFGS